MNTVTTTGDPLIDGILGWLTNGGSLNSPGAVICLGALIKIVLIPLLARLCAHFNINFSGPNKLHAVVATAILLTFIVDVITRAHLKLGDVVTLGFQIGLTAIGIHASVGTISEATSLVSGQPGPLVATAVLRGEPTGVPRTMGLVVSRPLEDPPLSATPPDSPRTRDTTA